MEEKQFNKEIESFVEFKLLDKVVKGEVSVQDACQEVVNMTMGIFYAAGKGHDWLGLGDSDYRISLSVIELAERLEPSKQIKLVEFMTHLHKQIAISTNEVLRSQGSAFWANMPTFGYTELETWGSFGGSYKDPWDPKMNSVERDRWTKLNAFDAQLTQAADVIYPPPEVYLYPKNGLELQIDPLDKSLRALEVMQMTLENDTPVEELVNTAAMEATCLWFIYAAEQLWENSLRNYTYPKNFHAGAGGKLWGINKNRNWSGFTRDRWEVWKEMLEDASCMWGEERMLKLINDALASMRRAMGGDQQSTN